MTTKYYTLSGMQKWGGKNLFVKDTEYSTYSMNLYPDEKTLKLIKDNKIPFKFKVDEDGTYGVVRWPHEKTIKGEVVVFGPPEVLFADGNAFEGSLGNGSTVSCDVAVYDYTWAGKTKQAMRLNKVHVTNYVEYKKPDVAMQGIDTGKQHGSSIDGSPVSARPF